MQYGDFAVWQRRWLQGEVLEHHLGYWRDKLAGVQVLDLPTDRPRPAVATHRGDVMSLNLSSELTQHLKQLSRTRNVTLFMTLLAGFQVVLSRYAGQVDVAVGTDVANRNRIETEGLIGFFVNQLVLRTDLSGNPNVMDVLERVRENTLEAYAHQDLPFEKLVEELEPERDMSRSPLFDVKMVLQNAPEGELRVSGVDFTGFSAGNGTAKFDLSLFISEQKEGLSVTAEYATDLYERVSIERLVGHMEMVFEAMASASSQPVTQISLLSEAERQQVLREWNDTRQDYDERHCLHELIEQQSHITPDAVAVLSEQHLSYRELDHMANRLAHHLQELGVTADTPVAVCVERSLDMVIGLLAVLKAGAAYVPVDPSYPQERLAYMLDDTQAPVMLTQRRLVERLTVNDCKVVCLDEQWGVIQQQPSSKPEVEMSLKQLAYVIYTSGSTGKPKGAMNTHAGILNRLKWMQQQYQLSTTDRVLQKTTFSFDVSVWELFWPLMNGATLVMAEAGRQADAMYLRSEIEREQVTVLHFVPSMLESFLEEGEWRGCGSARLVVSSGEALSASLVKRFKQAGGAGLENLYGPTEAAVDVTRQACEGWESSARVPIGQPISNTRVYVVDKNGEIVPVGIEGELLIGGVAVGRGYWKRPGLTAGRFVPDPFGDEMGGRVYRTGDRVKWRADGNLEFLGRIDRQVKLRGHRIELGEIETALNTHSAVAQCAVILRDDALVAYVVASRDSQPSASELRAHLQSRLPDYMMPAYWLFLQRLPLTANGKLDHKALPAVETASRQAQSLSARTPAEEIMCGIWSQVLRRDDFSIEDNFFELGGHSLLATQVISRVRSVFGHELSLRQFFEQPTVKALAAALRQAERGGGAMKAPPIVPVNRNQPLPLSFAQQRLWFIHQLEPGSAAYNSSKVVRLLGAIDQGALCESFRQIVKRHEVLRTRYWQAEAGPVQEVGEEAEVGLPVVDLSRSERGQEQAEEVLKEEAERPFDLERGPVLRLLLVKMSEEEHLVSVTIHHIASDGWSVGILVREFSQVYEAMKERKPWPLKELGVQYGDFAVWQRRWLQGEVLEEHMRYWREELEGLEPLELPTDGPRPVVATHRGAREEVRLSRELSGELKAVTRREGATVFMTLLGGLAAVLARYSGQKDIAIGTDVANRNRLETEGLIGFFANQLVLRTKIERRGSFRELMRRVREVTLGAYANQDLPFEKLVEELGPERELSRTPLFDVKMVLQNAPSEPLVMQGLKTTSFGGEYVNTKFDLMFFLEERGSEIGGVVEYATDLFDRSTIQRLLEHYRRMLELVVAHPDREMAGLPLLTEAEQQQVLREWNSTDSRADSWSSIQGLFEEQALSKPDSIAVTSGDRAMSYGELNRRANLVASHLRRLGVGPEVRVGLYVERSEEMVAGLMGVLKAGGAYVPLDVKSPVERLAYMLDDAGVAVVLTQGRMKEGLPWHWSQVVDMEEEWGEIEAEHVEAEEEEIGAEVEEENLAYVIYTSGSTGQPKAVAVTHGGLSNYLLWARSHYDTRRGAPVHSPLSFDLTISSLLVPLVAGSRVSLIDDTQAMDELAEAISQHSLIKLTPSHMVALRQMKGDVRVSGYPTFVIGGEALSWEEVKQWEGAARLINEYGPTETVVGCCVYEATGVGGRGGVPIGRPIANTRAYVVDEVGEAAAVGVGGELYIGGAGVARGYLNKAGQTAEKFVPDAFGEERGGRLYRTGDRARWMQGGELQYLGRRDEQVKVRGYRIELGEIEAVMQQQAGVAQCAVMVREGRLVAYVSGAEGQEVRAAELREEIGRKLPVYIIPGEIVVMGRLPLTRHGKVDRRALPEPQRAEGGAREGRSAGSAVEEIVVGIWGEVLGREEVGVEENFFELGGHSLLATQVISRIRAAFGVELPLRALFDKPTIAELAKLLPDEPTGQDISEIIVPVDSDIDELVSELEQMSEEEAQALLANENVNS